MGAWSEELTGTVTRFAPRLAHGWQHSRPPAHFNIPYLNRTWTISHWFCYNLMLAILLALVDTSFTPAAKGCRKWIRPKLLATIGIALMLSTMRWIAWQWTMGCSLPQIVCGTPWRLTRRWLMVIPTTPILSCSASWGIITQVNEKARFRGPFHFSLVRCEPGALCYNSALDTIT